MSSISRCTCALLSFSAFTLLSGCVGVTPVAPSSSLASSLAVHGIVHGGQQPVTGATIQLYAVGTTGDGSAGAPLGSSTTTAGDGSFSLTGKYNCSTAVNGVNTLVYLLSTGGNPGSGTNANLVMMAALGPCSSLNSSTFIFIDEVTTVGAVAALYPYMTSAPALGSGSSDAAAFATAFGNVSEYTNTATGSAPGPNLPGGYYASSTEINTLGNIIAACVNSTGGVAGDATACGNLFNLTKSGSTAPTNTIGALINILNNPAQNVSGLFGLPQPIAPFQPSLSTAPTTWALPILPIAATPSISPVGGTYSSAQFVTISDTSSGAVIHYTIDGSTPTASSATYTGTITVSSSETLKAIAVGGGYAASAVASAAYTITGSTATYAVNGQINLSNGCGTVTLPTVTVTLTHGTTVVQTTTTNGSGGYSFSGVPNGTYTVTPSITGPASAFYPASQTAVVTGSDLSGTFFTVTLGYAVSGTVSYGGSQTGQVYLALNSTNCGGGGTFGTSITSPGAYTIRGVPPGTYTLQANLDNIGMGATNASNPVGSAPVTVGSTNLTGQNVSLTDPATVTLSNAPNLQGVAGFNNGVIVQFKPITNSNKVEMATYYTLQWSIDPAFGTIAGSKRFNANGTHTNVWLMHGLGNGNVYYFRAYGTSAGTTASPYSSVIGPVTIGAPTGTNLVTGAITFAATPTGPLYLGFADNNSGNFYGQYIASPVSAQAYSIEVPIGSNYFFVAILDQNNDGVIDAGDLSDTGSGNDKLATVISGPTSNENLTLASANSTASVTTQNYISTTQSGSNQSYSLNFQINGVVRQPVAVSLASGPNLINPVDIAICGGAGSSCGQGFQINFNIGTTVPTVGDTYTFNVTYSDGTTGVVTASVSAVLNAFATSLAPTTGTSVSTTPTFSWVDPINASNYIYSFNINNSSGTIWQVPGNNSNSNGLTSATTSLVWGVDPTDNTNTPSPSTLTLNTTYYWQIQVQDSNGNSTVQQVQYTP